MKRGLGLPQIAAAAALRPISEAHTSPGAKARSTRTAIGRVPAAPAERPPACGEVILDAWANSQQGQPLPRRMRAVLLLGLLWRCAIATKQECAVCEDTIGHLAASAAARARSEAGVRAVLEAYCEQERLNTAEAQMCYVLEPMRQQVSAWVALGVDAKRTCAKISRMNGEACALFHESKVDAGSWVEYRPMTAKRRAIVYE